MRLASVKNGGDFGVALQGDDGWKMLGGDSDVLKIAVFGGRDALAVLCDAIEHEGQAIDIETVELREPFTPDRIFCVGLNYADHAAESGMTVPEFPTLFSRFASTILGPTDALRLPKASDQLDFEGELAVVIGRGGRSILKDHALDHVAGYACFNDASLRDFQLKTTQWMLGKNFDGTGPFGPYLVTPEGLPPGASGLAIETRLNGQVVQHSRTDQLIFDVATLIADISIATALLPGDVIITGTPSGVGNARQPKLFMKAGDLCEVEIEGLGTLSNLVVADV